MLDTAALLLVLVYIRRRRIRRYQRCVRCNPCSALRKDSYEGSYRTRKQSDGSSSEGQCYCSDNSESGSGNSKTSKSDKTLSQRVNTTATKVNNQSRVPLHAIKQDVIPRQNPETNLETMRRYPTNTGNTQFSFSVRPMPDSNAEVSASHRVMCPPVGPSESFTRHMTEIEYWVKTHRPPCTYGMPAPALQAAEGSLNKAVSAVKSDTKQTDNTVIKRPIDPNQSSVKNFRRNAITNNEQSSKPKENTFFCTAQESSKTMPMKTNGSITPGTANQVKKSSLSNAKFANGTPKSEWPKTLGGRPTSTPILSRANNVKTGKKSNSVINKTPQSRTRTADKKGTKINGTKKTMESVRESPGPSNAVRCSQEKPFIIDDSDTSVLTAPYIRSTRNSAAKSKCQSLTRQRASLGKNNLFATRSRTRSQNADKTILNASFETKESSAANQSKVTSDSSLDIFGGDMTKESSDSRRSTLRSSKNKNFHTLHAVPRVAKASTAVKRRSEPVTTRTSAKRALLSNSCQHDIAEVKEENGFSKRVVSAPCVRTDDNKCGSQVQNMCGSEEDTSNRRKFFI